MAALKNHKHLMRAPIVVYADFESYTRPIDACNPDPEKSFTKKYQKHEPSGFCFFVKCLGEFSQAVLFTKTREEENVSNIFVERLEKEIDRVWSSEVKPMMMTDEDKTVQQDVGFAKKILLKVIKKFAIIVTTLENFAKQHIIHVTFFSGSRNMFWFSFITSLVVTLTSSSRAWEKVKDELIVFPITRRSISVSQKR